MGYRLGGIWTTTAFVGRGPVGEVYECSRPEVPGTLVAKLLPEELLESSEIWSSYLAAVSAAGALQSDATVRHVAFGSDLQLACPFVVTDRVTWPSLAACIAKTGPIAPKPWGKTLRALIGLLERAHADGIAHGRLTPTNLFISPDAPDKIKVTDFGVGTACAARAEETLGGGVAGWTGPESEAEGAAPTPAGDVYSLGLLTFFALTGKPLYCAVGAKTIDQERIRNEMSVPLRAASEAAKKLGAELEPAFDKWFARTVVPSPTARYASVKLLGEAFEHVLRRMTAGSAKTSDVKSSPKASAAAPRPASSGTKSPSAVASILARAKPAARDEPKAASPKPPEASSPDSADDEPTIRLSLETLLAKNQKAAEPARIESVATATVPAPIVTVPTTVTAEPATIAAEPARLAPEPVAVIAKPPPFVPPPPMAFIEPELPAVADAIPPATAIPALEAPPFVETAVDVASAVSAGSAPTNVGTGSGDAPHMLEKGTPLLGRPKVLGAIALGLVLFGVLVGLALGAGYRKPEPAAEAIPKGPAGVESPASVTTRALVTTSVAAAAIVAPAPTPSAAAAIVAPAPA
ncbi:MAG TPA: hypothetical protein VNN72_14100, partial [Polyangiaceae bacterium]|nr:hypothetical protein [Polyangiaceae bacterium]